jgi:hypothetical protein
MGRKAVGGYLAKPFAFSQGIYKENCFGAQLGPSVLMARLRHT